MRVVAIGAVLLLAGCSGTKVVAEGSACGQPFRIAAADYKDRSEFTATITCADGGSMTMASKESLASPVAEINAQVTGKLADLIGKMLSVASPLP